MQQSGEEPDDPRHDQGAANEAYDRIGKWLPHVRGF